MFTGIVEELGIIASREFTGSGARLTVAATTVLDGTSDGDSIAVNGVCLTALDVNGDSFGADVSPETLDRTTLGRLGPGSPVNLERAVTPQTRLGGHFMQGHVDGTGVFLEATAQGDYWTVTIGFPAELARYLIHKGSIAVEGISLTIAELSTETFKIAVIPKTWTVTNLSTLKKGDDVNLEVDVIAKYVERMMQFAAAKRV